MPEQTSGDPHAKGQVPKSKAARMRELLDQAHRFHDEAPERALRGIDNAEPLARSLGDQDALFEIAVSRGRINARQGRFSEAEDALGEALELSRHLAGNDPRHCKLHLTLGAVHFFRKRNEMALSCYLRALSYGQEEYLADININIANIYHVNRDFVSSLKYLNEGMAVAEKRGDTAKVIYCLSNMGANYIELGRCKRARKMSERALALIDEHGGNAYMRCNCLLNLGEALRCLDLTEEAEDRLKEASRIAGKSGLYPELANAQLYLGRLKEAGGESGPALYYYYRCLKLSNAERLDGIRVKALVDLQNHFEKSGDFRKAYRYLVEIIALRGRLDEEREGQRLGSLLKNKEQEINILEQQKSEIERQKSKLQKVNTELEQSVRELQQYAYIVAHDLREPLRSISGFTGLLKHRYLGQLDEQAAEYMDYVIRSVSQMNELLTELLRYSTIESEAQPLQSVNLELVMRDVLDQLKDEINARDARITVAELPTVQAKPNHMYLLFYHLMHNALRFNTGPEVRVEVSTHAAPGGLHHFSVTDNGIGIDPAYHERIFKIFNRLDKENFPGTGIGLAICKKIVTLYSGQIGLESEPGKGSTFQFTLKA